MIYQYQSLLGMGQNRGDTFTFESSVVNQPTCRDFGMLITYRLPHYIRILSLQGSKLFIANDRVFEEAATVG